MAKAIASDESNVDKLGKLLPSEVTGIYVIIRSVVNDLHLTYYGHYLIGLAILSTVLAWLYIVLLRQVSNKFHIFLYTIAFLVWAISLDVDHIKDAFSITWPIGSITAAVNALILIVFYNFIPTSSVASMGPQSGDGFGDSKPLSK